MACMRDIARRAGRFLGDAGAPSMCEVMTFGHTAFLVHSSS